MPAAAPVVVRVPLVVGGVTSVALGLVSVVFRARLRAAWPALAASLVPAAAAELA